MGSQRRTMKQHRTNESQAHKHRKRYEATNTPQRGEGVRESDHAPQETPTKEVVEVETINPKP